MIVDPLKIRCILSEKHLNLSAANIDLGILDESGILLDPGAAGERSFQFK